jgi:pyridoxamine 5'-phosphate oxidase
MTSIFDAGNENPFELFSDWYAEAKSLALPQYDAMVLATADQDGKPSARMVLFKGTDQGRFCFFTNLESRKASELKSNVSAQLLFYWSGLGTGRQIRIEGRVEPLSREQVERYFHSRHRRSQVGAAVSQQSKPLRSRDDFLRAVDAYEDALRGAPVPVPAGWGGYGLVPDVFEFWVDQPSRLHERKTFSRGPKGGDWRTEMLYP